MTVAPAHTNAPVVGTGASRRAAEAGPVSTEERAAAEYLDSARDATTRLVVFTSVVTDVFGRRQVRAVVLPVPASVPMPSDPITHRGRTWTRTVVSDGPVHSHEGDVDVSR